MTTLMDYPTKLQLHHYFNDGSHRMDALIRNKAEAEFLAVLHEVADLLDIPFQVETEAVKPGGLVDIWSFLGDSQTQIALLISIFSLVMTFRALEDRETKKLKKEELKLALEERRIKIQQEKLSLHEKHKQQHTEIAKLIVEQSDKVLKRRSNFYKQLSHIHKLQSVSYTVLDQKDRALSTEQQVNRASFVDYIHVMDRLAPEIHESVEIEVITPVLHPQNHSDKWKGLYQGKMIVFSMGDEVFLQEIINRQIAFRHGSVLQCNLRINRKINEVGEVVVVSYVVEHVYEHRVESSLYQHQASMSYKQKKKTRKAYHQGDLF